MGFLKINVRVKPGPEGPESETRIVHLLRRMVEIGTRVLKEERANEPNDDSTTGAADRVRDQPR